MKLCLLHLDDALHSQADFISHCEDNGACHVQAGSIGSSVRLWGRNAALDELNTLLYQQFNEMGDEPKLWFMGSGDFHHVSALLVDQTLVAHKEPVTIIHFDNHPDWVHFKDGMHCGSWVNRAAANPSVAKIITVGVSSKDLNRPEWKGANLELLRNGKLELFPYWHLPSSVRHHYGDGAGHRQVNGSLVWKTIFEEGESNFLAFLLSRIETKSVYLTIDKDVLRTDDAITNWDQGQMQLPYLLKIIRAIGQQFRIVGADVTGDYSVPHYSGSLLTRAKKRAEIFIDQPHGTSNTTAAARINSAGNHALLNVLQEVMA